MVDYNFLISLAHLYTAHKLFRGRLAERRKGVDRLLISLKNIAKNGTWWCYCSYINLVSSMLSWLSQDLVSSLLSWLSQDRASSLLSWLSGPCIFSLVLAKSCFILWPPQTKSNLMLYWLPGSARDSLLAVSFADFVPWFPIYQTLSTHRRGHEPIESVSLAEYFNSLQYR